MEILEFLQDIRTPFRTAINLWITELGSETVVIGLVCLLYWCINKKFGYRIAFVYFVSGLVVQTAKVLFKVPRPWIQSKTIAPVDEAVGGATGYSFPSGHTQSATALYGTIAYHGKRKAVQLGMLALILLVAFSRLYLGVHTPMDVSVAMFVTLLITIGMNYVVDSKIIYKMKQETLLSVLLVIPLAMLMLGIVQINFTNVNYDDMLDFIKSAGAATGFAFGWYFETKYLDFDETKGNVWQKALRYIIGIVILLAIKSGLKVALGENMISGYVRYLVTLFVGIYLYPLVFTKSGNK